MLDQLPGHRLVVVGGHTVPLGDGGRRRRRADDLPDTAFRAYFAGLSSRADRGTTSRSGGHGISPSVRFGASGMATQQRKDIPDISLRQVIRYNNVSFFLTARRAGAPP